MAIKLSAITANRCRTWNICPLGDLAKHIGCRRPECPAQTMADVTSPVLRRGA